MMGRGASFLAGMAFSLASLAVSLGMLWYAAGFAFLFCLLIILSFAWDADV